MLSRRPTPPAVRASTWEVVFRYRGPQTSGVHLFVVEACERGQAIAEALARALAPAAHHHRRGADLDPAPLSVTRRDPMNARAGAV